MRADPLPVASASGPVAEHSPSSSAAFTPMSTVASVLTPAFPARTNDPLAATDEFSLASYGPVQGGPPGYGPGRPLMQGFFGGTVYEEIKRTGGGRPTVDGSDDDLSKIPSIGGGGQWSLAGNEQVQFGLEGNLAFNWRANASAVALGGGGAVVAVDVDLLLFDLYGGPFVSLFIGDRVRLYGAVGPLMQWANYDQEGPGLDGDGSGFGLGYYARTGLEFGVGAGTLIGFGMRWSDSTIDLNGNQGELKLQGIQFAFTVSRFL